MGKFAEQQIAPNLSLWGIAITGVLLTYVSAMLAHKILR